jgi:hypothetical protein
MARRVSPLRRAGARQVTTARAARAALLLALSAAPAPALAQRDVGPVRVALFAGTIITRGGGTLVGVAGELELHRIWTLAAAASYVGSSTDLEAQYELDARWRPPNEGALRPYLGGGFVVTSNSIASLNGPARTRFGGLALLGMDVALFGTTAFAEAVGVETGSLTFLVRGGVRLLVIGP